MGREIRMVPPHWEHPITKDNYGRERKQPMYDERFDDSFAEWLADFDRIRHGSLTDFERSVYTNANPLAEWLLDDGQPRDPAYYRPWADEEATWFQLWETVSEGTPVSPPFATREELIAYLAENGDEWDQKRCMETDWERLWGGIPGKSGWGAERATRFVSAGWAPSMIVENGVVTDGKFAF